MPTQAIMIALVAFILPLLPVSPFTTVIESFSNIPWLAQLNWFFPVSECIAVLEVWIVAVGLYYIYSAIMRWIKIIS